MAPVSTNIFVFLLSFYVTSKSRFLRLLLELLNGVTMLRKVYYQICQFICQESVVGGASLDFVRCVSYSRHLAVGQLIASLIAPHPVTTFC